VFITEPINGSNIIQVGGNGSGSFVLCESVTNLTNLQNITNSESILEDILSPNEIKTHNISVSGLQVTYISQIEDNISPKKNL
jgi:hypothetical protein